MENKAVNKEFVRPSISKSSIFVSNHCPVDVETSVGMHIHRELELLYQESGQKTVVTNSETYHMEQGDIILFNSNTPHEIISHPHSVDSFIQFRLDAEAKTLTSFQNYLVFCNGNVFFFKRGTEANRSLGRVVHILIEENEKQLYGYQDIIRAEISNLLTLLQRYNILQDTATRYKAWFLDSLYYIEEHYAEEITLQELCDRVNVTPTHFCRVFHDITKTSFTNYLNYVRINKAEALLTETKDRITDIALQTGFSSIAYFSKVFRQYKNCTPGEYRRMESKIRQ